MTDVSFDRLRDVALRDAWPHEALGFTPWLAQNIDHIAEAVGRPLELTGKEVPVGTFSADILARNLQDDSVVLIENQLEQTDHTHLGQIMTYLAGLDAKIVIWIAPSFREPHLSAIRWLNQHTAADGFSFFALRLRVVRIGDSPFAPIFEVVEKPNEWERGLQDQAREPDQPSRMGALRRAFWAAYLDRYPEATRYGVGIVAVSSNWIAVDPDLNVALLIGLNGGDVTVRGPRGGRPGDTAARLDPFAAELEHRLGAPMSKGAPNYFFTSVILADMRDPENWPEVIDFLHERGQHYAAVLRETFGPGEPA